jgi:hypothetical protein
MVAAQIFSVKVAGDFSEGGWVCEARGIPGNGHPSAGEDFKVRQLRAARAACARGGHGERPFGGLLGAADLSKLTSRADLDAVLAATADATLKQSLTDHTAAIVAAAEQHPHVEAVIRTIESAPGTFTKVNTTPEALKKAAGGDIALFDTLQSPLLRQ